MERLIEILESKLQINEYHKIVINLPNTLTIIIGNETLNISVDIDMLLQLIWYDKEIRYINSEEYYIDYLIDTIKQELKKIKHHAWSYYPNDHNTNISTCVNMHTNNKLLLV